MAFIYLLFIAAVLSPICADFDFSSAKMSMKNDHRSAVQNDPLPPTSANQVFLLI